MANFLHLDSDQEFEELEFGGARNSERSHPTGEPRFRKECQRKISRFIEATYEMLMTPENREGIEFNQSGTAIEVKDIELLGESVLPKYFKHGHVTSFTRQLNNYDFELKVSRVGVSQTFAHPHFRKGRKDLLMKIERRKTKSLQGIERTHSQELQRLKRQMSERLAQIEALEAQNLEMHRCNHLMRAKNDEIASSLRHLAAQRSTPRAMLQGNVSATPNIEPKQQFGESYSMTASPLLPRRALEGEKTQHASTIMDHSSKAQNKAEESSGDYASRTIESLSSASFSSLEEEMSREVIDFTKLRTPSIPTLRLAPLPVNTDEAHNSKRRRSVFA